MPYGVRQAPGAAECCAEALPPGLADAPGCQQIIQRQQVREAGLFGLDGWMEGCVCVVGQTHRAAEVEGRPTAVAAREGSKGITSVIRLLHCSAAVT